MTGTTRNASATWVLPCLGALILGVVQHEWAGVLAGAALGWLVSRVWALEGRVARLAEALAQTPSSTPRATAAAPAPRAAPVAPMSPGVAMTPAPVVPAPVRPVTAPSGQVAQPVSTPAAAPHDWIARALAWIRGGNPLARLGIVILFFGAAFLAKYAAEHSYVPVEARFVFIALGAVTLLVLGWRLRGRQPVYAHLLQGGGVAGLYLTVFAATRLYQLLPPQLALALMVVVAIASAVLAVAQDSLPLAVIGTAGGFLAPILVSTGSSNHVALFTYYTVLNLGVFTVAWFRAWRVLNLVGFVFTFGIAGFFRAMAYAPEKMVSTDFFVVLFFLMYVAISVLFSLRQKPDLKGYVSASLVFGLPVAAFTLHATLVSHIEHALAWSSLALGGFYLALAYALLRSARAELRLLCEAFAALGAIFASLAVPLAFDQHTTAAMWAVEGAGLLWLGVRQDRALARAFGTLLQLAAGVACLAGWHDAGTMPFLNGAYLGTLLLAISGLLSGGWMQRHATRRSWERSADILFALWGLAWWLGGGLAELHRAWPDCTLGAHLGFLAATAGALHRAGTRRGWRFLARAAIVLMPLAAAFGLLQSLDLPHPLAQAAWLGWPLLLAMHYALLLRLDADDALPAAQSPDLLHAGAAWLIVLLAGWESSWQVGEQVSGVWPQLPWGIALALALWLCGRQPLAPRWPLAAHDSAYRVVAAAPIALAAALWILAIDLSSDGDPAPLPYLALLNPLDLTVAATLLGLARWWRSLEVAARARLHLDARGRALAIIGGLTFLWLDAALARALHWQLDTPLDAEGMMHSTALQAAFSVFWGLLGFAGMVFASRRASRELWVVGAALMGVVVAKLFLVDTAGSGTLGRIVSFLVVGVLLLVTGYLSPLPPPRRPENA